MYVSTPGFAQNLFLRAITLLIFSHTHQKVLTKVIKINLLLLHLAQAKNVNRIINASILVTFRICLGFH